MFTLDAVFEDGFLVVIGEPVFFNVTKFKALFLVEVKLLDTGIPSANLDFVISAIFGKIYRIFQ